MNVPPQALIVIRIAFSHMVRYLTVKVALKLSSHSKLHHPKPGDEKPAFGQNTSFTIYERWQMVQTIRVRISAVTHWVHSVLLAKYQTTVSIVN